MAHQPGHPGYEEVTQNLFNTPAKKKKKPPIADPGIPPSGLAAAPADPDPVTIIPAKKTPKAPEAPVVQTTEPRAGSRKLINGVMHTYVPGQGWVADQQQETATTATAGSASDRTRGNTKPPPTNGGYDPAMEGYPEPPDQSWAGRGPGKWVEIINPRDPLGPRVRLWQPEGHHYQWYWNGPQGRIDYKLVPLGTTGTTAGQNEADGSYTTGVPATERPPDPDTQDDTQDTGFNYDLQPLEDARSAVDAAKAQFDEAVAQFAKASGRVYEVRWTTAEDGFDYPTVWYRDVDGAWTQDKSMNFKRAFEALDSVYKRVQGSPQDFREWLNRNPDYGSYRDMGALIDRAAKLQDQWERGSMGEDAFHEAARILGFDSARDMQQFLQNERANMPANVDAAQGLRDTERTLMDRAHWFAMSEMREQMERDIDAIAGETGSTMRAFQAADGYRRQVTSANLNYLMSVDLTDQMRKQANFDSSLQRYDLMVSQGLMSAKQAALTVLQDRASQMQAFAMGMSAVGANNAQLTAISAHDQQMLDNYVSQITNIINMDLGMQVAVREGMDEAYNRHVKPYMDRVGVYLTKLQQDFERYELEISRHLEFAKMDWQSQENARDRILAKYIADNAETGGGDAYGSAIGTAGYLIVCKGMLGGLC